ncbi:MAG: RNA polymerase sigma factor [Armatimonadota bacterium]
MVARKFQQTSDSELISAVIASEAGAFEELANRHRPLMLRIARDHFGLGTDDAEDIVQDVFARLLAEDCRHLKAFHGECKLSTWLFNVTRNRCIDFKRRKRPDPMPNDDPANGTDVAGTAELRATIGRALEMLPSRPRLLLQLRYFQGLSYREIGQLLGVPPNTVGSGINRAKKRLREILGDRL